MSKLLMKEVRREADESSLAHSDTCEGNKGSEAETVSTLSSRWESGLSSVMSLLLHRAAVSLFHLSEEEKYTTRETWQRYQTQGWRVNKTDGVENVLWCPKKTRRDSVLRSRGHVYLHFSCRCCLVLSVSVSSSVCILSGTHSTPAAHVYIQR